MLSKRGRPSDVANYQRGAVCYLLIAARKFEVNISKLVEMTTKDYKKEVLYDEKNWQDLNNI